MKFEMMVRCSTSRNLDGQDLIDEDIRDPPDAFRFGVVAVIVFLFCGGGLLFYEVMGWGHIIYTQHSVGFGLICYFFMYLDWTGQFYYFQRWFERPMCGVPGGTIYSFLFFVIGTVCYILRQLWMQAVVEEGTSTYNNIWYASYGALFFSYVFFFGSIMASWNMFSYYSSQETWCQSLMVLMMFPYCCLLIVRFLRPLPMGNTTYWYRRMPSKGIVESVIGVLLVGFMLFIVLGGIVVVLFAEFCRNAEKIGIELALLIFGVFSMTILLTPLAPGSIVDACGGFVFIQIYHVLLKKSFFESWLIGIVCCCILHWIGACCQWWIGTWPCVQISLNNTLPIGMLAASDAVLRTAGWFQVGAIGYVFMDTANGLNQGRINMEFWTQLFSEWACVPAALSLVTLGATIAAPDLDWAIVAVPLLMICSSLVQSAGSLFGASRLAGSTQSQDYWMSREKWITMQHFRWEFGAICTMTGYAADIYELKSTAFSGQSRCLYEKVHKIHTKFLQNNAKEGCTTAEQNSFFEQYIDSLTEVRHDHYAALAKHFARIDGKPSQMEDKGYIIYEELEEPTLNFFASDSDEASFGEYVYFIIMLLMFWMCFNTFPVTLEGSVRRGLKELDNVKEIGWISFAIFSGMTGFYYHREILANTGALCSCLSYAFCECCAFDERIETMFVTYDWKAPDQTN